MSKGLYLVLGVAIGGAAGWFASKYYYDKKAAVKIASGKDFEKTDIPIDEKREEPVKEKPDRTPIGLKPDEIKELYSDVLGKKNYGNPDGETTYEIGPSEGYSETAYLITADEFASYNGFEKVYLTYYAADETLEFDGSNVKTTSYSPGMVYDEFDIVGNKFAEEFEKGDVDVIYIRNESFSTDFEITYDGRSYEEVSDEYL